ncbi:hypothetical protein [Phreatobacter sp.]|uniref:hypothetical protein n=1 Tax=Phreatobacter sp. TaxID=1966341 RepID=UPI003F6EF71C
MTVLKVTALILGPLLLALSVWLNRRAGGTEDVPGRPFPIGRLLVSILLHFGGAILIAGILLAVFGP